MICEKTEPISRPKGLCEAIKREIRFVGESHEAFPTRMWFHQGKTPMAIRILAPPTRHKAILSLEMPTNCCEQQDG